MKKLQNALDMRVSAMIDRKTWFVCFTKNTADSSDTDEIFLSPTLTSAPNDLYKPPLTPHQPLFCDAWTSQREPPFLHHPPIFLHSAQHVLLRTLTSLTSPLSSQWQWFTRSISTSFMIKGDVDTTSWLTLSQKTLLNWCRKATVLVKPCKTAITLPVSILSF